jgi:hypothetical protein
MGLGVAEFALILACCGGPLLLIAGAGTVLTLVKLGVIGHYWLKGEEAVRDGGDYTLDQSRDIAETVDDDDSA